MYNNNREVLINISNQMNRWTKYFEKSLKRLDQVAIDAILINYGMYNRIH